MHMNPSLTRRHGALALVVALFATSTLAAASKAAPDKAAEKKLIAKVFTDGTIFGFAKSCKVSEPDLKRFYDKTFASSREIGVAKVPQYSQADFRRDFQNGIGTAERFSASVAPASKAYTRNCEDVHKKVSSVVDGKP